MLKINLKRKLIPLIFGDAKPDDDIYQDTSISVTMHPTREQIVFIDTPNE